MIELGILEEYARIQHIRGGGGGGGEGEEPILGFSCKFIRQLVQPKRVYDDRGGKDDPFKAHRDSTSKRNFYLNAFFIPC